MEKSYKDAAANFNNILASVSDELKEFVELQGEEQRQTYMTKCLEQIRGVHGSLDRTQFIPMIISNVTTHHALALNQRVNSVTDSSTDHDITHAYPGCHHGCRLEVRRVPLKTGVGA